MQHVTFHPLFLLISIIFVNKCAKIPFFLSKALATALANFLSHKQSQVIPITRILPNFQLGIIVPSSMVIVFNFYYMEFSPGML